VTEQRDPEQTTNAMVFVDPSARLEIRALAADVDDDVTRLLTGHPGIADHDAARALRTSIAARPKAAFFGAYRAGKLIAVYALTKDGLANDLATIVVDPAQRRQGVGRMLLQDALRRSGKRPLVAQTPEAILPFFKACGFKMVGRRVQPSGEVQFRVGWHAPGARFKGGTSSALDHLPLKRDRAEQ
jgi:ribosomal protein S18 acetylase RimI-like enzyme